MEKRHARVLLQVHEPTKMLMSSCRSYKCGRKMLLSLQELVELSVVDYCGCRGLVEVCRLISWDDQLKL